MRRTLAFILAGALLLAGFALAGFEITHAEALRSLRAGRRACDHRRGRAVAD
jgi:hypothetical protein